MDDYASAFICRCLDTNRLYGKQRKIATMHFGGITVECILKKICFVFHGIGNWGQTSTRTGNRITNPGHSITNLVMAISILEARANASAIIMSSIRKVQEPCGINYIMWRYQGNDPSQTDFDDWYRSYVILLKWLVAQSKTI